MKRILCVFPLLSMLLPLPACAAEYSQGIETPKAQALVSGAQGAVFSDVPQGVWYEDAARSLLEKGLMVGTGGGEFDPEGTFSRAQLAQVLYRLAGEPPVSGEDSFFDTSPTAWYATAILWAEQNRVVTGDGEGHYMPDAPVTQEQLVTMLWRIEGEPQAPAADHSSSYAAQAVGWVREIGIAHNTANYAFSPQSDALRCQVAVLLQGYLQYKDDVKMNEIQMTIDGEAVAATWEDNASVDALRKLLMDGPRVVELSRYGGFEQVGSLGARLPRDDIQTTTAPGDIVLYSGNQLVLFFGSNSWAYTRLGRIIGLDQAGLQDLLGGERVTAVLSLSGEAKY